MVHSCTFSYPLTAAITELQQCLCDVQNWMGSNKLKLNPDKTEFILFDSPSQHASLAGCFPVDILGSKLCPTELVRNLQVFFDSGFTFSKRVASVSLVLFINLILEELSAVFLNQQLLPWQMYWSVVG